MTEFSHLLKTAEADSLVVRLRNQVDRLVAAEAALQRKKEGPIVFVNDEELKDLERVLDEAADYIESMEKQ